MKYWLPSILLGVALCGCSTSEEPVVETTGDPEGSAMPMGSGGPPGGMMGGGPPGGMGGGPPGGMGGGFGGGGGGGFDPAAIFDRRDEDGDGKLTGDEISERMAGRVEQIDKDGDGSITRQEFIDGMQSMFAGGGPGGGGFGGPGGPGGGGFGGFDPGAFFDRRDENGDGKLSGDEISERMADRVAQIDKDGDGALTKEEFTEGMRSLFSGGGPGGPGGGGGPAAPEQPEQPETDGATPEESGDAAPETDGAAPEESGDAAPEEN